MNPEKQNNAVSFIAATRKKQNDMAELLRQVNEMSCEQIQDFSALWKNDEFAFLTRRERIQMRDGIDCIGVFTAELQQAIIALERMELCFTKCPVLFPLVVAETERLRPDEQETTDE